MKPTFPILLTDRFWTYLIRNEEELSHLPLKGVRRWNKEQRMLPSFVFDSAGLKWTMKPELDVASTKLTFWQRLLSYRFYNPMVKVDVHWTYLGAYFFQELKDIFASSLGFAEDRLSELVEDDVLIEKVNETTTMQQLLAVIDRYELFEE